MSRDTFQPATFKLISNFLLFEYSCLNFSFKTRIFIDFSRSALKATLDIYVVHVTGLAFYNRKEIAYEYSNDKNLLVGNMEEI